VQLLMKDTPTALMQRIAAVKAGKGCYKGMRFASVPANVGGESHHGGLGRLLPDAVLCVGGAEDRGRAGVLQLRERHGGAAV
jgi:hypothetical protein